MGCDMAGSLAVRIAGFALPAAVGPVVLHIPLATPLARYGISSRVCRLKYGCHARCPFPDDCPQQ